MIFFPKTNHHLFTSTINLPINPTTQGDNPNIYTNLYVKIVSKNVLQTNKYNLSYKISYNSN